MTRLLERLRENDESLTALEESDLRSAFRDELKAIKDCKKKHDALKCDITDRLKHALKENTSITKVSLHSSLFLNAFGHLKTLQEFTLSHHGTADGLSLSELLGSILHQNKGLQKFRLHRCLLSGDSMEIAGFFATLRYHPSLEVFEWVSSDLLLPDSSRHGLTPLLLSLCTIPKLKTVEFSTEGPSMSFDAFSALFQLRSLERLTLEMQFQGGPEQPLDSVVWAFPLRTQMSLKHLKINMGWTYDMYVEIVRAVHFCGKIESLELGCQRLSGVEFSEDIAELVDEVSSLKHLALRDGYFSRPFLQEGTALFESFAHSNLESLDLNHSHVYDELLQIMARDMIAGGYRSLKHMDLWNVWNLTLEGWVPLIRALTYCPSLEELKLNPFCRNINGLHNDNIDDNIAFIGGDDAHEALLSLVKSESCSLKKLSLEVLDSRRFAATADAITRNTSLKEVEFVSGDFCDDACRSLAQALLINTSLRSISIMTKGDVITDQGWVDLVLGLKRNTKLEQLKIHFGFDILTAKATEELRTLLETNLTLDAEYKCCIDEEGAAFFEFYTKLNRLGRHALLTTDSLPRERWVEAMIDADGDVSVLFYWLKKNPSVLCDVELEIATKNSVFTDYVKRRRVE